jgi:hypothetical protein
MTHINHYQEVTADLAAAVKKITGTASQSATRQFCLIMSMITTGPWQRHSGGCSGSGSTPTTSYSVTRRGG